jgi:endonuclease YncB( thermonuclease family)
MQEKFATKTLMGLVALVLWMAAQATTAVAWGYEITGKVVSVADGDTMTVRSAGANQRIRLASIDAPEKGNGGDRPGQPYSEASRRFLAEQVAGSQVTLECFEQDRYERHICNVLLGDVTANQLLVYAGMAWANRQGDDRYLRDQTLLLLQADAQANKRGLWAEPEPIAPWVWRVQCWRQGQCTP